MVSIPFVSIVSSYLVHYSACVFFFYYTFNVIINHNILTNESENNHCLNAIVFSYLKVGENKIII